MSKEDWYYEVDEYNDADDIESELMEMKIGGWIGGKWSGEPMYPDGNPIKRVVRQATQKISRKLRYVIGLIKWRNAKCKICGKPATANGDYCESHFIPF
jgi:hypothetical protein